MALDPVVNFFRSEIATLPLASGTTTMVITTGDGNKLPDPAVDGAFNLTIYNADDPFVTPEIVRCTAKSGDSLTITRAQEGTSATNKTTGSTWYVELVPTAKTIQDIDDKKLDVAGGTMTGDLTIPDKIIHSGDTNTAIRFPSDDTFAIETDGTEKIRATSTAVVVNESGLDQDFRVEGDTLANLVFVDASTDRVGINTATPATLLDVNGDVTITDKIIHSGDTNTAIRFPSADTVTVETNGTEAIRVNASQNVGITRSSPLFRLDVPNESRFGDHFIVGSTRKQLTSNASTNILSVGYTFDQTQNYLKIKFATFLNNSGVQTREAGEFLVYWRSGNDQTASSKFATVGDNVVTFGTSLDTGTFTLTINATIGAYTTGGFLQYSYEILTPGTATQMPTITLL